MVFDTETTGLLKPDCARLETQPRVIEIAWVHMLVEGRESIIVEEFDSLIQLPEGLKIPDQVKRITGIDDKDLEGQPFFHPDVAEKFVHSWVQADYVVAHNFSYDYRIVNMELQRHGGHLPDSSVPFCTVEATEHLEGFRLTLTQLYEKIIGSPMPNAHRALDDVKATAAVFGELNKQGLVPRRDS